MVKTFNEAQMTDPWAWCLTVIEKHELNSIVVSEAVTSPRSTIRALLNGTNVNPRYNLLIKLIRLCIEVETGTGFVKLPAKKRKPVPVATIDDFL